MHLKIDGLLAQRFLGSFMKVFIDPLKNNQEPLASGVVVIYFILMLLWIGVTLVFLIFILILRLDTLDQQSFEVYLLSEPPPLRCETHSTAIRRVFASKQTTINERLGFMRDIWQIRGKNIPVKAPISIWRRKNTVSIPSLSPYSFMYSFLAPNAPVFEAAASTDDTGF